MIDESLCIYEYERVLMGQQRDLEACFLGSEEENIKALGYIWRYAVLHLLHWTPEEAVLYLDDALVMQLCLNRTFRVLQKNGRNNRYQSDYKMFLQHAFPGVVNYDSDKETLEIYEHVAKKGKWRNDTSDIRSKKRFFDGFDGMRRASVCLNYIIGLYLSSMTREELYEFFGDEIKSGKWLEKQFLKYPIEIIYDNPLEYLHEALPPAEKDDFYYYANIINNKWNEMKEDLLKENEKE